MGLEEGLARTLGFLTDSSTLRYEPCIKVEAHGRFCVHQFQHLVAAWILLASVAAMLLLGGGWARGEEVGGWVIKLIV